MWCLDKHIWLSAAYIPSALNVEADSQSRLNHDNIEWELNKVVFNRICEVFFKPDIDLFASRLNHKVEQYIAWKPDPFACAVDAFTVNWKGFRPYIFAPFSLISKILQKIEMDQVDDAIIVIPLWTTQPWFSKLLRLLISCPFLIPRGTGHLLHPGGQEHSMQKLQMAVCRLSATTSRTQAFQRKPHNCSWHHGGPELKDSIRHISRDGCSFAVKKKLIHCHPLL